MSGYLTFAQILNSSFMPVIAVIAIWIAYQQYRTAKDKLKLDLYDRRFRVYRGLMDFLGEANKDGRPSREAFTKFYCETDPAPFLFASDVCDYLERVRQQAVELRNTIEAGREARADKCETIPAEQLTNASRIEREKTTWFFAQGEVARRMFLPYLGFEKAL